MFRPAAPLALALLVAASPVAAEPTPLFSDRSADAWTFVTPGPETLRDVCTFGPDGVIACAGRPPGYLATTELHRDYRLHVEWRWPGQPGNGGILVHIVSGPKDRVWPECLQVQLKHRAAGDVLPMAGAQFAEPLTSPPGATAIRAHQAPDSERPPSAWNTAEVICRGDTVTVLINGVEQNRVTGSSAGAGRIGFQFEGAPFELRHVTIEPAP